MGRPARTRCPGPHRSLVTTQPPLLPVHRPDDGELVAGPTPVRLVEARPDAVTLRPEPDPAAALVTVSGAGLASLSRTPG